MLGNKLIKAAAGNAAAEKTDEHFQNTVLLLHGDGNQGATNFSNTGDPIYLAFKDNSSNNFPITVNGDAYGDNFGPYALEDGRWSNYFNGSTDYLDVGSDSNLTIGTSDFTISMWCYFTTTPAGTTQTLLDGRPNGDTTEVIPTITYSGNDLAFIYYVNGSTRIDSGIKPNANEWYWVVVSRSSGTTRMFINGVQGGSDYADSNNYVAFASNRPRIGSRSSSVGNYFGGYISGLQILVGTGYSSVSVPTAPPTAITNTQLLTCQSNRFVDNSTNNFAITPAGNVAVKVFNPFGELPDGVNGSGYFPGDNNYLTVSPITLSGDFCVEAWVYTTTPSTYSHIFSSEGLSGTDNDQCRIENSTGGMTLVIDGSATINDAGTAVKKYQWNHLVYCRSGTGTGNCAVFCNGVRQGTGTSNGTPVLSWIGERNVASAYLLGYMSNLRVVSGDSVYDPTSTTLTVPTAPLTEITGTELLTCQYAGTVRNVGFIDSGPYDFPITRVGNTTQGTFSPFSAPDGRWSNYFDGAGDRLGLANNAAFDFGSGDFTIEGFFYLTGIASQNNEGIRGATIFSAFRETEGTLADDYSFGIIGDASDTGTGLRFAARDGGTNQTSVYTATITKNEWHHFAVTKTGSTVSLFYDGVRVDQNASFTNNVDTGGHPVKVGGLAFPGYLQYFPGYTSNVRVVKGSVVYSGSTYTVPTAPLTAVSGTSLLTCQSNRFVDNSSNAFAITRNGDVKVTPFSPFAPTAAYDASVNGGSGYFDGVGDYLQLADDADFDLGTNAFCIEAWIYPSTVSAGVIFGQWDSGSIPGQAYLFDINSGNLRFIYRNSAAGVVSDLSVGAITANTWSHVVVCRDASNNWALFVNGTRTDTSTQVQIIRNLSTTFRIGETNNGVSDFNGYISSLRVVNKSSVYDPTSTTLTVPTSPLTAISNTVLLLNFTNAGIFDQTGKNNLETVGNAQIDTATKKYGTGSMKFDGTGDYIDIPFSQDFVFGTGDFTVELWVYVNSTGRFPMVMLGTGSDASPLAESTWALRTNATSLIFSRYDDPTSTTFSVTWAAAATTWYHIAVTRSGTDLRFFVDGTQVGSTQTSSTNFSAVNTTDPLRIGRFQYGGGTLDQLNGFIDDLRITKGVARYTTTFTPPTKAFPDL